jgi:hypothetical protein
MRYYVYELVNPKTEHPYYIGKGCRDRCLQHFRKALRKGEEAFGNKHLCRKILKFYEKLGEEGLQHRIIKEFEEEQKAYKYEEKLISEHGRENLCNIRKGGEGVVNTPEVRKRISCSVKNWRKSLSEEKEKELRRKISEGQSSYWSSEKSKEERTRRKQQAKKLWNQGKLKKEKVYTEQFVQASMKQSEEVKGKSYEEIYGEEKAEEIRNKISEALSGQNNPQHGKELKEETKKKISKSTSGKSNPNAKTYVVNCNGKIREFETRKEVKKAVKKYNEENDLGWGEKIVYGNLFEEDVSKSWEIVNKE